jgi:hypothetical protein
MQPRNDNLRGKSAYWDCREQGVVEDESVYKHCIDRWFKVACEYILAKRWTAAVRLLKSSLCDGPDDGAYV